MAVRLALLGLAAAASAQRTAVTTTTSALPSPTVSISPPTRATDVPLLSQVIGPSFHGFGIEPSNLFSFTGWDDPNELSINMMTILANLTGLPPYIRLGGNTQDYFIFNADFNDFGLRGNDEATGQGAFPSDQTYIGSRYFEALDRFPYGTPVTFGLNLAYSGDAYGGYLEALATMARQVITSLSNVALVAFEIGNEPDLYSSNGFRPGAWDGAIYAQEFRERAEYIWEQVLKPLGLRSNFFEPSATASTISSPSFNISLLDASPLTAPVNGSDAGLVSAWSQHDYFYYIGVSQYPISLDFLMNLAATPGQFVVWAAQIEQAHDTPHPYVLREMASVGPVGLENVSDVFGATLWTLNFFLYMTTLNVSSTNFHMTDNSYASPWQPIEQKDLTTIPHVRTTFYAFAAMAQLIGTGCNTRFASVPVAQAPGYEDRLAAYTSYQNGNLSAIIMLNMKMANETDTKGNATFRISLPGMGGQALYLSYLTAAGADSKNGTVFNGVSYEETDNGLPALVNDIQDIVMIPQNGRVSIAVRDSQAIVANVGGKLGASATTIGPACEQYASTAMPMAGEASATLHPVSTSTVDGIWAPTGATAYNGNGQKVMGTATPTPHSDGSGNGAAAVPADTLKLAAVLAAAVGALAVFL